MQNTWRAGWNFLNNLFAQLGDWGTQEKRIRKGFARLINSGTRGTREPGHPYRFVMR
jgi:hypothetical protein